MVQAMHMFSLAGGLPELRAAAAMCIVWIASMVAVSLFGLLKGGKGDE